MKKTKTAVITGGTKGLGEAITREFYKNGYLVVIGARNDTGLAAKLGKRAFFQETDVCDRLSLKELVKAAVDRTGRIDAMINNAGFSQWYPLTKVDEAVWARMIDTNLKGTFFGCQAAAQYLKKGGCIINVSSLAGKRGSANNSVYCASKFGVNGITQALAKELGLRNIRVNAVCPVYIRTKGLLDALYEPDSPSGGKDVDSYFKKFAAENAALRRLPTAKEVAQVCLFLASDQASAITGQCINVDCGVLFQ